MTIHLRPLSPVGGKVQENWGGSLGAVVLAVDQPESTAFTG